MPATPRPSRSLLARPSLGEPSRAVSRTREPSPGASSHGSPERSAAGGGLLSVGALPRSGRSVARNSRDPRPVGDKAYAAHCAKEVCNFLNQRGFGRNVSAEKFLKEPMTKDFFEIFRFMMQQLDPQLEIEGKMEDEVPLIMRRLKYPVEVNRSKLQAISGPNTWPQLLAVLDWLLNLIEVNEAIIEPVAECKEGLGSVEQETEVDHHTMRTLHENYQRYLRGEDDDSVQERLRQVYDERIAAQRGEVERLQGQKDDMEMQLQDFNREHDHLLEIQAAPQQLAIQSDHLRAEIKAADAKTTRLEEEIASAEAEEQLSLEEIGSLSAKSKELQAQVEAQAYSKQDIERLKHERTHLRKILAELEAESEKAEQDVWESSMEDSSLGEAIGRAVRAVHNRAEVLEGAEEAIAGLDLSEPTDALAALDFGDAGQRAQAAAAQFLEEAKREDAKLHDTAEEQRVAQEELYQHERECRQLKCRQEELTRMREEQRVVSEEQLDDARRTAEECENAVRAAGLVTSESERVREAADRDALKLHLKELQDKRLADRKLFEDRIRREQEAKEQHQEKIRQELRVALEGVEKISHDIEKAVEELQQGDEAEEAQPERGGA